MKASKIIFAASLLIISVFALSACSKKDTGGEVPLAEQARPAKIVPVVPAAINVLRSFPGTLESSKKAELAFRVGGQLAQLPVVSGQRVKKGDLLARLDDSDFNNTLEERQARYELAHVQHNQSKKLLKQKLTSQLKSDQAVAELKSAKAALDQARDNLKYTQLLAPFDSIVARVNMENYQAIQAKAPVIQLHDDQNLDIHFNIPESLINQMRQIENPKELQKVCGKVNFSAHPDKIFKACHKEHESVPDSVTRNYEVTFFLERVTDFVILPGMSVSIEIDFSPFIPDNLAQGWLVPVEAVFEQGDEQWVWRVNEDMRAKRTSVTLGNIKGDLLEIRQGVSAEDLVIAAGVSFINEGMLVSPLVKERGL